VAPPFADCGSVDEVFLAIEVCGSRFALPDAFAAATPYQKIADAGMNVALLLGPAFSAAEMKAKDLAGAKVELIADGVVGGAGTGADVLGDPINSLCYLANALGRTGDGLPAGTLITTGAAAVMQPTEYKAGDTVVAKFDGIGELALNIAADAKM
jgi:2-keto-4-pentenoate hydratase